MSRSWHGLGTWAEDKQDGSFLILQLGTERTLVSTGVSAKAVLEGRGGPLRPARGWPLPLHCSACRHTAEPGEEPQEAGAEPSGASRPRAQALSLQRNSASVEGFAAGCQDSLTQETGHQGGACVHSDGFNVAVLEPRPPSPSQVNGHRNDAARPLCSPLQSA
ncbi:hypothetical protein GHT09_019673 [Marmota monax]|uniref:Uncharacterized protein n=1 Tax=Marmota monax TaxID=9995 RepID=A0A834PJ02_MARMO|nr:hypothetical protein GHT09_019673 [Marmota monax]